ncbi:MULTISPECIES: phosphatase PAP2 family protein [unclassified Rhodanobacter]|uniref:acid phosphatase n=1 Tax=unclassified Rhodanobacter TaxID=2621553 RepID=UPI001BDDDCC9|nr:MULTISPECIES: phosphatase PAP2 family protein [unclassified Rhodanobacter]MBT2144360.1 phosphatase PAP2 family protein [Rhodanobacter sp. LX-99]MBT2149973.1 phosphatase PAP2 family protein [Rhodanobacter sp. LX-100]
MQQHIRRRWPCRFGLILAAATVLGGCANDDRSASAAGSAKEAVGYLAPAQRPRATGVLPPAPQAGSARYEADRQIFKATRQLQGTPRWTLATGDADGATPAMLRGFSCAVGVPLDAVQLPRLVNLLDRAGADADHVNTPVKQANRRQRPFQIDDGAVCQPKPQLAKSFDYPSGQATLGWTIGLILAELAPDRATDIDLRARAYADSRMICGAHNYSAIEAGAMNAAIVVAALHASPAFRQDVESARRELASYRQSTAPIDGQQCAAERTLISASPY